MINHLFNEKIQDFPSDMGYPLGGSPNEFKYFVLQLHYNNPQLLTGNISYITLIVLFH